MNFNSIRYTKSSAKVESCFDKKDVSESQRASYQRMTLVKTVKNTKG